VQSVRCFRREQSSASRAGGALEPNTAVIVAVDDAVPYSNDDDVATLDALANVPTLPHQCKPQFGDGYAQQAAEAVSS
jgi:hypothetical protein